MAIHLRRSEIVGGKDRHPALTANVGFRTGNEDGSDSVSIEPQMLHAHGGKFGASTQRIVAYADQCSIANASEGFRTGLDD